MKTLKISSVLVYIIMVLTSCSSNAQEHPDKNHKRGDHWKGGHRNFNPDTMAKNQTERMKQELSLSADQEGKVADINLKYAKKRKEMMDEMQKQMEAMDKENEKELQGVLTADQFKKLQQDRKEWKSKGRGKGDCSGKHQKK